MKMYFLCEMDVGDSSDIVHQCFANIDEAQKTLSGLKSNPRCEIPFYIMQSEVEMEPQKSEWHTLKLEPCP